MIFIFELDQGTLPNPSPIKNRGEPIKGLVSTIALIGPLIFDIYKVFHIIFSP